MKKIFHLNLVLFILGSSCSLLAAENTLDGPTTSGGKFRCEKVHGVKLAEFKEKLVSSCDLDKPFSTSLSEVVADQTYLYCCHTK